MAGVLIAGEWRYGVRRRIRRVVTGSPACDVAIRVPDAIIPPMPLLELPHTAGCLVCGRDNPHGLHLHLHVDEQTSRVQTTFTPQAHHIGFEGIVHGGVLATVLDEAMVWAATWQGRRFCVCGEMTVRFRQSPPIGQPLRITAEVTQQRARLVQTTGLVTDASGRVVATSSGKYVPLDETRHRAFVATFVREPATARAATILVQE